MAGNTKDIFRAILDEFTPDVSPLWEKPIEQLQWMWEANEAAGNAIIEWVRNLPEDIANEDPRGLDRYILRRATEAAWPHFTSEQRRTAIEGGYAPDEAMEQADLPTTSPSRPGGDEAFGSPSTGGGTGTGGTGDMSAGADRALIGDGARDGATTDDLTTAPGDGSGAATVPFDGTLAEPGTGRQIPGEHEVWRVGNDIWLAYEIPGTNTPLVWQVEDDERAQAIFGTTTPDVDRTLSRDQFKRLSPWQIGGLSAELLNTDADPWQAFMSHHERAAELRPWLNDVDFMAVSATAYLEGREVARDEISQTDWWQNHTAAEREWMDRSATAGQAEVERMVEDQRRSVEEALRQSGSSNVPHQVLDYIAEQALTGRWSESYAAEQIRKVSDPFAPGELDAGVRQALAGIGTAGDARAVAEGERAVRARVRAVFGNRRVPIGTDGISEEDRIERIVGEIMSGDRTFQNLRESVDRIARSEGGRPGGLDITRENEDKVRQLATRWLGPSIGNLDQQQIAQWAGKLRNDPDAEQEFVESLKQQRLALLPGYENPNLTYEDIVQPVRNLASQTWGQPINDEGLLVDLANTMDYTEMAKRLRQQGLERGIAKPTRDALSGLMGTSIGQRVQRSSI